MSYDDALFEAIRAVLDLDLPEEACSEACQTQAALLAGMESDNTAS